MTGVLGRLQDWLCADDLNYLIMIGGVLFREGMREFESSKKAREIICTALKQKQSMN